MGRAAALGIAAALAFALGAASCGGGSGGRLSKSQYEARMSSIVKELDSVPSKLGSFSPTDVAAADGYFRSLADTFDRLHAELAAIKPPKDVQTLHAKLAGAARGAGVALRALAQRLKAASPAERQRILTSYDAATQGLLSALTAVQQTAGAIVAKGYRFG